MFGLYVHIPFCRKKCGYCDFVSYQDKSEKIPFYLDALTKEIELFSSCFKLNSPDTLYIGGGTPSMLSVRQFEQLFDIIYKKFGHRSFKELSVECNPDSLDIYKLVVLKQRGVNRLSIGMQSFDNRHLRTLGRIHDVNRFLGAFASAREAGYDNINVDMIYGIPGQTLDQWCVELAAAVNLAPEHISIYPLTIENNTRFLVKGIVVDDDLQADMYEFAVKFLEKKGYRQYELSNFSLPGKQCQHNRIYWHNHSYLGIGAGAASYIAGTRRKNISDIAEYIFLLQHGRIPVSEEEKLEGRRKLSERLILGLRLIEGVDLLPEDEIFIEKLEDLRADGLVDKSKEERWSLTSSGKLLANHVFRELI